MKVFLLCYLSFSNPQHLSILGSLYLFSGFSLIERFFIYFSRGIKETIYLAFKKSKHMTLADVTEQFKAVAAKAPNLGKSLKYDFPVVCMTNSGNFQGEMDPKGFVHNSRHIPGFVGHRKTFSCMNFI